MAVVFANDVKETSESAGTGTLNLGGASSNSRTFLAGIGNGNQTAYKIDDGAGNREYTWGQVASGSPNTLTRGQFISSTTGSRISFGAGIKTVTAVPMSELFLLPGVSPALAETDIASATTCDLGSIYTLRARITGTAPITSFGTQPHTIRIVRFAGILTLTHNATTLALLTGSNRTTAANDVGIYISDASGNVREFAYFKAGNPYVDLALGDTRYKLAYPGNSVNVPGNNTNTTLVSTSGGLFHVYFDDGSSHGGRWLVACGQFIANPGVLATSLGSPGVSFAMSGTNLQMAISNITPANVSVAWQQIA